jgi:hypothetical protein
MKRKQAGAPTVDSWKGLDEDVRRYVALRVERTLEPPGIHPSPATHSLSSAIRPSPAQAADGVALEALRNILQGQALKKRPID